MTKRVVAVVAAGGIAMAGCGSDSASDGAAGNGTDRAFVAAMIPRHESAVQMAAIAGGRAESDFAKELASNIKMMIPYHEGAVEMARDELDKGKDQQLRELAQNIIDTQQREIDQMIEHSKGGEGAGGHGGHDG